VIHLVDGDQDAGIKEIVWNGTDARGIEVPTGMYLVHLTTLDGSRTIKLVMMK